jgi:hypothetical protein
MWAWQAACAAQGSFRGFNSPASNVVLHVKDFHMYSVFPCGHGCIMHMIALFVLFFQIFLIFFHLPNSNYSHITMNVAAT